MRRIFLSSVLLWLMTSACGMAQGASSAQSIANPYRINAGDTLDISVWQEDKLTREVQVRPDGAFSFPLAGEVVAAGRTVNEVHDELKKRLAKYIPDLVLTVAVKDAAGNRIFLIGQVEHPGAYVMNPRLDVVQALSLAGGMTAFADKKDIHILRRSGKAQKIIPFDYTRVEKGRSLAGNILLRSGDTIVVP